MDVAAELVGLRMAKGLTPQARRTFFCCSPRRARSDDFHERRMHDTPHAIALVRSLGNQAAELEDETGDLDLDPFSAFRSTPQENKICRRWRRKKAHDARFEQQLEEDLLQITEEAHRFEQHLPEAIRRIRELKDREKLGLITIEEQLELVELEYLPQLVAA